MSPASPSRLSDSRTWFLALRFGFYVAALAAVCATAVMATWEWIENPGGIFRSDAGTNWAFVGETAISWFAPTFFYAVAIAFPARLCWLAFRPGQASSANDEH